MSAPDALDPAPPSPPLRTHWFDGISPKGCSVTLQVRRHAQGAPRLHLRSHDGATERDYPLAEVRWPERRSRGQRQAELPDGGLIQHAQAAEWDAWAQASGLHEGRVVGWMQSWRATLAAALGTVLFMAAAWVWGVPLVSTAVTAMVPERIEEQIGDAAWDQLSALFLKDSQLPEAQQARLQQQFAELVERAHPAGEMPPWQLAFRHSKALGANAFALPGGRIVMTDDLVQMMEDQPDAILGVLAHELGHVQHRHGLDLMVRASLVSALVGVVVGDASGFLATVPATLATQSYSRDAERQADDYAARTLHQGGLDPAVMALFFERVMELEGDDGSAGEGAEPGQESEDRDFSLPIAISSHPDHAERIAFFRDWRAGQRAE